MLLSGGIDSTTTARDRQEPRASSPTRSPSTTASGTASSSMRPAGGARHRRRQTRRGHDRPARSSAGRADRRHRRPQGPRESTRWPRTFRSPTCRRATRSSSRYALAWAEVLECATSSSASTPSTTAAIPIAGRSTSRRSSAWPTWPRKPGVEGHQRMIIHTPLIQLTKAEIIRQGLELGVDYSLTSLLRSLAQRRGLRSVRLLRVTAQGLP